ncbi:MAG: molecular chaperone TorD family protein [Caldilineaceae bacterium]
MNVNHVNSRSHAYALFANLLLYGISESTLPIINQLSDLAAALPQPFDLTQAAVAHEHLLGMNIFANESFFLDQTGLVGGEVADGVLESYRRVGYTPPSAANSADHMGAELGLLSFLAGAQADALTDGQAVMAQRMQQEQRLFLQQHLLRWLAPCVIALQRAGDGFYAEVANLLLALVADHWRQISAAPIGSDDEIALTARADSTFSLPITPDLLENDKTSLRDIAEFLVTPPYAGIYVSRDAITELGRQQQLPRGFGERKLLLNNLLQAAAQYDLAVTVFHELGNVVDGWCDAYAAIIAEYPLLKPFVSPWQQRATQTRQLLTQISQLIPLID